MSVYQGGNPANEPMSDIHQRSGRPWQRWQDWVNLLLGVWLFVSPWAVGPASTATGLSTGAEMNDWITGLVIGGAAIWALSAPLVRLPERITAVVGIWLLIVPWIIRPAHVSHAFAWNEWTVGVIVFILSIWALSHTRDSDSPASHA